MKKDIINQQQAEQIFTRICEKNQWEIFEVNHYNDIEYVVTNLIKTDEESLRYQKHKLLDNKEVAKRINFFSNENPTVRLSNRARFQILAGFLGQSNLSSMKSLKVFLPQDGIKNLEPILNLLNSIKNKNSLPLDDIMTVVSNYHSKISIKSSTYHPAGDLPNLFKLLNKCKLQDNSYDLNPTISSFCSNHLDQILEKQNVKTFIFNQLKELVPEKINYYREFLQIDNNDKDIFSEEQNQYKTFHLDKKTLFNAYPLSLNSLANSDDYYALLESATVFLNKKPILEKLKCKHIEMSGKQQIHENFILTVDAEDGANIELLKFFLMANFKESVSISSSLKDCSISKLKYEIKDNHQTIFDCAALELSLPVKETSTGKKSKI